MSLETDFILEYFVTMIALDRSIVSMLSLLVSVHRVFVDQFEADITLQLVGVWNRGWL